MPLAKTCSAVPSRLLAALLAVLACPVWAQAPAAKRTEGSPLVVGYFGQWGVYDGIFPRRLVSSGAAEKLDQINYAQGFVTNGRCTVADPNADLNLPFAAADAVDGTADAPGSAFRGDLHQMAELKRLHPRLKVLISLEGKATDFAADAQPANRAAFVASCIDLFVRGNLAPGVSQPRLFDGIDLDWEYPHDEDGANFLALLTDLRAAMDAVRPGLRLTVAVGPSPRMYPGVDVPALAHLVDQVGVMNYDYHGPWNPTTNFIAPLVSDSGGSVAVSLAEWAAAGIPRERLLMGLPFYGYGWQSVPATNHGLLQPGHSLHGDRPWSFFAPLVAAALSPAPEPEAAMQAARESGPARVAVPGAPTDPARSSPPAGTAPPPPVPDPAAMSGAPAPAAGGGPAAFTLFRDPASQAPWLFDGSTFWTFEDPASIAHKARFARDQQLGGVMIWELGEDATDGALLHAAEAGLRPVAAKGSKKKWSGRLDSN